MDAKSREEINMIKSKFQMGISSRMDLKDSLVYMRALEALVEEASMSNFYGAKGWEHRLGWTQTGMGE